MAIDLLRNGSRGIIALSRDCCDWRLGVMSEYRGNIAEAVYYFADFMEKSGIGLERIDVASRKLETRAGEGAERESATRRSRSGRGNVETLTLGRHSIAGG